VVQPGSTPLDVGVAIVAEVHHMEELNFVLVQRLAVIAATAMVNIHIAAATAPLDCTRKDVIVHGSKYRCNHFEPESVRVSPRAASAQQASHTFTAAHCAYGAEEPTTRMPAMNVSQWCKRAAWKMMVHQRMRLLLAPAPVRLGVEVEVPHLPWSGLEIL